ncbi:MAG: class I SAM-dependent methyltransferase [Planctomycetes bacterium]|nr:class I SAM-dependent methyltransferase [Planctomycetota bacterium]
MPTSVPYALPIMASVARQLRPASVLDVGVGFGKYGFLFREYTDIWNLEHVGRYGREHWRTRIEGVEATPEYITPLHRYVYDEIHLGDVREVVPRLGTYDVIVMGDVLEHFTRADGDALLDALYARARQCLLLTFPIDCAPNAGVLGNPYEAHRSAWNRKSFRRFPQVGYKRLEGYSALVALTPPSQRPPLLTASFAARRRSGWKQTVAWVLVNTLGAGNASRLASWVAGRRIALRT